MAGRKFAHGHEALGKKSKVAFSKSKKAAIKDFNADEILKTLDGAYVEVVSGSSERKFKLSGKRVSDIRKQLVDAFAIPDNSQAYANGKRVDETHIVQSGQTLEFIQPKKDVKGF